MGNFFYIFILITGSFPNHWIFFPRILKRVVINNSMKEGATKRTRKQNITLRNAVHTFLLDKSTTLGVTA